MLDLRDEDGESCVYGVAVFTVDEKAARKDREVERRDMMKEKGVLYMNWNTLNGICESYYDVGRLLLSVIEEERNNKEDVGLRLESALEKCTGNFRVAGRETTCSPLPTSLFWIHFYGLRILKQV